MFSRFFFLCLWDTHIDKNGTLVFDERTGTEDVRNLLTGLAECGFAFEGDIDEIAPVVSASVEAESDGESSGETENEMTPRNGAPSADAPNSAVSVIETPDRLVIEMPMEGFTATALDNLDKLVAGKAALILKAIGADALPIERAESTLRFPWFPFPASKDATDAYTRFVCALCDMAKKQKRVTLKEAAADSENSEKFAFRCFLLRLGFIGKEYARARKILLSKLSGNGSFKSGDHKRGAMPEGAETADSGEVNVEAISVRESETGADSAATGGAAAVTPPRCGECRHHCYYTGGLLHTGAGDIIDTSTRAPDKYTHYCLGAPSGFRKIKNAAEWSGCEASPKWCPLHAETNSGGTL